MKLNSSRLTRLALVCAMLALPAAAANSAPKKPLMATDIPVAIKTPDQLTTRLGTLKFSDGRPDAATTQKLYDNLDFQRGVQAFMNTNSAVSMVAMKRGLRSQGANNSTAVIFETLTDSKSLYLTANTDTVYLMWWLDTRDGPMVMETPPNVLGLNNDAWQRYVGDMGNAGPDKGQGGKFLLLPPGYDGPIPVGYHVQRSRTYGNWGGVRGFVVKGDTRPAVESIKKMIRVYPLSQAANPPKTKFVNASGADFSTVHSSDFSYFEELNEVVQEEPLEAVDPEIRGLLASIGIRKGQPFAPDARMKKILAEAAAVGAATNRAIVFETRDPKAYLYPDSDWRAFFIGGDYGFAPGGVLDVDARSLFYFSGTAVTPAMALKMVGVGSQYAIASHDADKQLLDGNKTYRLHLPSGIPVKNFWSITIYDPQTRSYLQTDQRFPNASSQRPGVHSNTDGSVDLWFGPKAPEGKEANWVQTWPGKGWFAMLRMYGPLQAWFDKSWKPGEFELVK